MKSPVVRLKIRVRLPYGSRPYLDPVLSANKKLKPQFALVNGRPEHHPEGVYHLRYLKGNKRVWEKVGSDAQYALTAKTKREDLLRAVSAGVPVVHDAAEAGPLLKDAIKEFLSETSAQKSKRTLAAYSHTLKLFEKSCHKRHVPEIDRQDLLTFMAFLKDEGNGPRTVANRIAYVKCFLRQFNVVDLLKRKDQPKYTQKRVSAYRREEVRRLLSVASTEESELIQFFLCTGARDQEVRFATWRDVGFNSKTFMVREKLDLSFTPKDKEEGAIPIPDFLVDMLKARKLR
ncbi:MAG: phage integrase N-terminal SAM-like domain-containing protein [Acidobacteriaceae bacterium]